MGDRKMFRLLILYIILAVSGIFAQETEDLISMSIEDILNMNIVSVSKRPENVFESPLSASVITREEILNSGATTFEECLRLVPGLLVREETHGNYDIHIRGYDNIPPGNFTIFSENTMTLVMVDGRKVFNHLNGGTFWETLPVCIDDIERIEIIRGPATSLYGPNAVTGVIHFITRKSGSQKTHVSGHLIGGSPQTAVAEASGFVRLGNNLGLRISMHAEDRQRFENTYYEYISGRYVPADSVSSYQIDPSIDPGFPMTKDMAASKKRWGTSVLLSWQIHPAVEVELDGGAQNSRAQTVFMETGASPLSLRTSDTRFLNFHAHAYGFQLQASGQKGGQDISENFRIGSRIDMETLDGTLEYAWENRWLKAQPGFSMQQVTYDDSPYLKNKQKGTGWLNGKRLIKNSAYFLRTEFLPFRPLRLIAAVRQDFYDYPDTAYVNFQLASTYRISRNHLIRAVYSRANRGPFFMDTYTDVTEGNELSIIEFIGNKNLRLPLTDMGELGIRSRLSEKVQMDVEVFYTRTKDLTSFEPDVIGLSFGQEIRLNIVYKYQNIAATMKQLGMSANLNVTFNSVLRGRFFGTLQQTRLENFDWKISPVTIDPVQMLFLLPVLEKRSFVHRNTPAFYGGFYLDYSPAPRWHLNAGLYTMSPQIYRHDYATFDEGKGQTEIPWCFIPSFNTDYRLTSHFSLDMTVKTCLAQSVEFGFAENIGTSFFAGLRLTY
jgi:iron complex outermembrane receptor protein